MQTILSIQHWLYSGMSEGLGAFAWGDPRAVLLAMGAAILFGAVHALMPGHGKTVLVSYHLGQEARPFQGFLNGAILAITHVGLAVVIVLAGFAVISRAFAYGGRTPQFEFASGVLVVLIGAFLLWRSLKHRHQAAPANGKALALVAGMVPCPLTTFILSYALARGVLTAGLAVTAAMTIGMIATIGGIALLAAFARGRFMALLARTETLRHRVGMGLEIGGALAVLGFGLVLIARA
ncbi:MAG TPA: ABC transporter permease [Methyloceanibacter sp.]|nr:ABC transporter permease [Methyloceanibacter sp.]